MTHSLADCPLRTFCCITTTHEPPFRILYLDHSALDLFLTPPAHHGDDSNRADQGALPQQRARLLDLLLGKTIADILSPECSSYPEPIFQQHPGEDAAVQSFVLSEQVLRDYDSSICIRQGDRYTRRLHGCIHTSVPYVPRPRTTAPVVTRAWSPDRQHTTHQQQQDQIVPQLNEGDQGASASTVRKADEAEASLCRVYVLKDATDMLGLAQEILQQQTQTQQQQQHHQQQQQQLEEEQHQPQQQQYHSMHLVPPFPSLPPSSSTSSSRSDRPAASLHSVTRHELYSSTDDAHWSGEPLLFQGAAGHSEEPRAANDDAFVLLLQVTRFGTVDHAFTLHPQDANDKGQHPRISVLDLTNTSVTALVHPDDIRTLCRGLDRVCKSIHILLRIRWRIQARSLCDLRCPNNIASKETTIPATQEQEGRSRWIEFQGEHFEEWVDSTAMPDKAPDPIMAQGDKDRDKEYDDDDDDDDEMKNKDDIEVEEAEQKDEREESKEEIYAWVEVTGTLSNGQPLLAIRPLTAQERSEQQEQTCMSARSIMSSQQSLRTEHTYGQTTGGIFNDNNNMDIHLEQESTEWKGKSKRMDLEEGMRIPRQLDVSSALTALTRISSQESAGGLRMPGSFPFHMTQTPQQKLLQQQLQQLQQKRHQQVHQLQQPHPISSDPRGLFHGGHSRSSSGLVSPMSSVLACPTATSTAPWSLFMSAALEAWRQWIQVVHAGQAQFQDWCEYVIETTIDQLIESVSMGLALLGVENQSTDRYLEEQQSRALSSSLSSSSSSSLSSNHKTKRIRSQSQDREQIHKRQKKMSGLHRAGQLLQGYPSLEGAVRIFGNSWLGLKIRSRLEQKMEIVADQVADWWEGENATEPEEQEEDVSLGASLSSQTSDGSSPRSSSLSSSSLSSPSSSLSCSTMAEMEVSGSKDREGSLEMVVTTEQVTKAVAISVN
ncbi:hypothetical protein EC968_009267 [Mortierella alpina]|nr:hypothetical protein EC968_009267 [Mortierella alpina]